MGIASLLQVFGTQYTALTWTPRVTVCDMAQVPLEDESVVVLVFFLSVTETSIRNVLKKANQVLKPEVA